MHCARCGNNEMVKATYFENAIDMYKEADTWEKKVVVYVYVLNTAVSSIRWHLLWYYLRPQLYRCTHCRFYDTAMPSSFHDGKDVMVPRVSKGRLSLKVILLISFIFMMMALLLSIAAEKKKMANQNIPPIETTTTYGK